MPRAGTFVGAVLALCVLLAPVSASAQPVGVAEAVGDPGPSPPAQATTPAPGGTPTNETLFREIDSEESTFVIDLNVSLLTSLFQQGSVLRIVTGGDVDGERVAWFDIGVGRGEDGFQVRSNMTMDFPGL